MTSVTSYTRAAVSGYGAAGSDDALTRINQLATRELALADIATFRGVVSRREVDTYGTIMETPTLRNYQRDFASGECGLLDSHNHKSLPIGRAFAAEFREVAGQRNALGDEMQEVAVSYYIQRGINLPGGQSTDDYIRLIEGGTVRDLSIGFDYSVGNCSICGKNQLNPKGGCRHAVLGEYDGGVICYQRVMDGRALESSLVWAASCPKSYIERARELSAQGYLPLPKVRLLEDRYGELILPRYGAAKQRSTHMADKNEPISAAERQVLARMVETLAGKRTLAADQQLLLANALAALAQADAAADGLWTVDYAIDVAIDAITAIFPIVSQTEDTGDGGGMEMGRAAGATSTRADIEYAFPATKDHDAKEPLDSEDHVKSAIRLFSHVKDVSDDERDAAWKRIKAAAKKYGLPAPEDDWRDQGKADRAREVEIANLRLVAQALGDNATPEAITRLRQQAADGVEARTRAIEQARTAYTAARGKPADGMTSLFESASLAQLEELTAGWQRDVREENAPYARDSKDKRDLQALAQRQTVPLDLMTNARTMATDANPYNTPIEAYQQPRRGQKNK